MVLGKQAACLRMVGDRNPDPKIAELELELKKLGNSIGMGAMGFVGNSMVVDCHIEVGYTHTGGMPISVHASACPRAAPPCAFTPTAAANTATIRKWFTPYMRRETVEWPVNPEATSSPSESPGHDRGPATVSKSAPSSISTDWSTPAARASTSGCSEEGVEPAART